jgi:CheY-like chemotaxis protein
VPRILVVDDDPMVCMAIEIYLERHGFQVTVADGGEAGLRALEGVDFDLMIVDIFMPHMRGFESIRIFHERAPTVPLIAMSGYAFANLDAPAPDFLKMALELGATRCLRKPFAPPALLTAINECLTEVPFCECRAVEIAIATNAEGAGDGDASIPRGKDTVTAATANIPVGPGGPGASSAIAGAPKLTGSKPGMTITTIAPKTWAGQQQ